SGPAREREARSGAPRRGGRRGRSSGIPLALSDKYLTRRATPGKQNPSARVLVQERDQRGPGERPGLRLEHRRIDRGEHFLLLAESVDGRRGVEDDDPRLARAAHRVLELGRRLLARQPDEHVVPLESPED